MRSRCGRAPRSFPGPQGLDLRPLPAAHRELLIETFQHDRPPDFAFGLDASLESAYQPSGHQAIAVDAHENAAELLLDLGEGFLDEVLAVARAQRDILELRPEVDHLRYRDQRHPAALGRAEVAPWSGVDAFEHPAREARAVRGLLEGRQQARRP